MAAGLPDVVISPTAEMGYFCSAVVAYLPSSVMTTIHNLGIPWWAALPMSAIAMRTLFVLPFFQMPIRKRQARAALVTPLIQGHIRWLMRTLPPGTHKAARQIAIWRARRSVLSKFDALVTLPRRLGGMAVLFCNMEALRRMIGYKGTVIEMMVNWLYKSDAGVQQDPSYSAETVAERGQQVLEELTKVRIEQGNIPFPVPLPSQWFDPALKTEGFSFCPDLTVPDPSFYLPAILIASWVAVIAFAPRVARVPKTKLESLQLETSQSSSPSSTATDTAPSDKEITSTGPKYELNNGQRIFLTFVLIIIGPASVNFPAAINIYLISNIWWNWIVQRWLAWKIPVHPPPTACKRPVKMTSTKEKAKIFTIDRYK